MCDEANMQVILLKLFFQSPTLHDKKVRKRYTPELNKLLGECVAHVVLRTKVLFWKVI